MSSDKIRVRYCKNQLKVQPSVVDYYQFGEEFTCHVQLHFIDEAHTKLWVAEIKCMALHPSATYKNDLGCGLNNKWYVKQEPGDSTREEFEAALKLATDFIAANLPKLQSL